MKISIIMPVYNSQDCVSEAINSILEQTYENFQLIIIDDCSTDDTYLILQTFEQSDKRIQIFKNKENLGVSKTRNFGIIQCQGEWTAFIDSDDLWHKDKLEKYAEFIRTHQNAAMIYSSVSFIDEDGCQKNYIHQIPDKIYFNQLLKQNIIHCSTIMVRSDVLKDLKFQNDDVHEDFEFCLKFLQKYKYAYGINEPLTVYRLRKNSRSANKLKAAAMTLKTYHIIGLNIFQMCYYFIFYVIKGIKKYSDIER